MAAAAICEERRAKSEERRAKSEERSADYAHHERSAAIEAAGFFTRIVVFGTFFAVAERADSVGANPAAQEIVADGVRATIAECEIVFRRPDVARVAFDLDAHLSVFLQALDEFVQHARCFGA
jgi:hypothetical protein